MPQLSCGILCLIGLVGLVEKIERLWPETVILFYYTILLLVISAFISGVSFSALMLSRNKIYLWFALAYVIYCLDVTLVFRPSFTPVSSHLEASHITDPFESVLYGAGILVCFSTVMLNYSQKAKFWRYIVGGSFAVLSAVAYFAIPDPHWRQFAFFSVRNVFSLSLLIAMLLIYLRTSDQFDRTRMARFRIPGLFITIGILGIIGENIIFQLVMPIIRPDYEMSPFLSERNFAENFVMLGVGLYVLLHCRRLFLLHQEAPRAEIDSERQRFADQLFEDYYTKYKLSQREQDVFRALISGHSNRQIADELGIAIGTVKVHIHNISKKTEKNGREEIVKSFFSEL